MIGLNRWVEHNLDEEGIFQYVTKRGKNIKKWTNFNQNGTKMEVFSKV